MRLVVSVLLLAAVAFGSVQVIRNDLTDEQAELLSDPECTSIFMVTLEPRYTVQGNDIGMLPPQGANVTVIDLTKSPGLEYWQDWTGLGNSLGGDYTKQPYASDAMKQALAKAQFSVTALTEKGASPLGFQQSTLRERSAVCVYVRGVGRRWVEIMAETTNKNQQVCVSDWKPENTTQGRSNLASNPFEEACAMGNLYTCRGSGNGHAGNNDWQFEDKFNIKFYCKDSCEDLHEGFRFRVLAAQKKPIQAADGRYMQPDSENWCLARKSDDFPTSLLSAYPANYNPPVVFGSLNLGASTTVVSLLVFLLSLIALLW